MTLFHSWSNPNIARQHSWMWHSSMSDFHDIITDVSIHMCAKHIKTDIVFSCRAMIRKLSERKRHTKEHIGFYPVHTLLLSLSRLDWYRMEYLRGSKSYCEIVDLDDIRRGTTSQIILTWRGSRDIAKDLKDLDRIQEGNWNNYAIRRWTTSASVTDDVDSSQWLCIQSMTCGMIQLWRFLV